jgi:hypothetical protein
MLVACDAPAALGEPVLVSLLTPGREPVWLDAEAEVARIVHGYRAGDPGYCIGLRFKYFERLSRIELLSRLAGMPPPIPQRRPRLGRPPSWRPELPPVMHDAGIARPVIKLSRARNGVPQGVFSA